MVWASTATRQARAVTRTDVAGRWDPIESNSPRQFIPRAARKDQDLGVQSSTLKREYTPWNSNLIISRNFSSASVDFLASNSLLNGSRWLISAPSSARSTYVALHSKRCVSSLGARWHGWRRGLLILPVWRRRRLVILLRRPLLDQSPRAILDVRGTHNVLLVILKEEASDDVTCVCVEGLIPSARIAAWAGLTIATIARSRTKKAMVQLFTHRGIFVRMGFLSTKMRTVAHA